MAVYKVPQDVEAEDKLLGPFSFRQFVYLIIAGAAAFIGWLLYNMSPFLVLIPAPIVVFFVILALPLRKDQPMEIYLLAVAQYMLKPKHRLWDPDGIISHVQLTLPQITEVQRTKDLTESEAVNRISYLAQVMDTRGWAARGVTNTSSMKDDAMAEAQTAEDILDTSASVSQSFDDLINKQREATRQDMMARMRQASQGPTTDDTTTSTTSSGPPHIPNNPYDTFTQREEPSANLNRPAPSTTDEPTPDVRYNPYPTAIRQQVIQPLSQRSSAPKISPAPHPRADHTTQQSASTIQVSPDIIGLANNPDLSISTIAREAKRIQERHQQSDGEVVIPLR